MLIKPVSNSSSIPRNMKKAPNEVRPAPISTGNKFNYRWW